MSGSHSGSNVTHSKTTPRSCNTRPIQAAIVIGTAIVLCAVVGVVVWKTTGADDSNADSSGSCSKLAPDRKFKQWPINAGNIVIDINDIMTLKLRNGGTDKLTIRMNTPMTLEDTVPEACDLEASDDSVCLNWPKEATLRVIPISHFLPDTEETLECYDITWLSLWSCKQVLTDCIDVTASHWYGGYADKFQYWPFEMNTRPFSAYTVNDSYVGEIGGVVDRYFVSSTGIGILIDDDVPLYFSLNDDKPGHMCFTAMCDRYPYIQSSDHLPVLKYKICHGSNVKDVHLKMSSLFIDRPTGIPNERLLKYPIWSTWAQYHKDISQERVIQFAVSILKHGFTHAQLEIDDDWTVAYGDMEFNTQKFQDVTSMVQALTKLGFHITLWVHPFFNFEARSTKEAIEKGYLIRQVDSKSPAITPWWDGNLAGILDVSNPEAVQWYISELWYLQTKYNISSFKFDAGETSWLPHIYSAYNMSVNPGHLYPAKWVELAAKADPKCQQEVRAGYKTQQYPMLIRMMDKMSNWGHDNAIKTIIPCVLTYGILGYPFVLPDMIGGNAYKNHPDPELFIRWLQLTTFMPSMQFSITPWMYNDTIIEISKTFVKMHEEYSDILIKWAEVSVQTGEPIVRPLWWINPDNKDALVIEDEFLVGDELLVAPVLDAGARSRDIFFPIGSWQDQIHNTSYVVQGPSWIRDYKVAIDKLAFFKRV